VRVEERPIPTLQTENDVLVKVVSSGLCGSDIPRIFAKGAHYYPITLGHEFSGYVESYGSAVTDLQPGDAVACVPLLPCFNCPQCQREYFSLCKQYQFVGSRSEGGNAQYVVVKRANLFRLPDQMPIDDGAFIEPMTVGLHAFHLAQGCEGKTSLLLAQAPLVCWRCSAPANWAPKALRQSISTRRSWRWQKRSAQRTSLTARR
jgi:galactitol-1-phosphate 5-dehydrogenase